jgi:hypothetical protein
VHRAIRAKEITAEQLVQFHFKRIEAYNGTGVKGKVDPATGLMLGEITPTGNAGQVNVYMTLNIRGPEDGAGCRHGQGSCGRGRGGADPYVAQLLGGTTEQAIRRLILAMVLCCDPLAIALTAATSARR